MGFYFTTGEESRPSDAYPRSTAADKARGGSSASMDYGLNGLWADWISISRQPLYQIFRFWIVLAAEENLSRRVLTLEPIHTWVDVDQV